MRTDHYSGWPPLHVSTGGCAEPPALLVRPPSLSTEADPRGQNDWQTLLKALPFLAVGNNSLRKCCKFIFVMEHELRFTAKSTIFLTI